VSGVAVRVTFVFWGKLALHVDGQLIPAGLLVIVPAPAGGAITVNWNVGVDGLDGELEPMPAPQPASISVDSANKQINQSDRNDFMTHFSKMIALQTIAMLDEGAWKVVGCLFGLAG
jgi:hypothetical protein